MLRVIRAKKYPWGSIKDTIDGVLASSKQAT